MPDAHPIIDLRSDTVTRPTPAMRRAMAEAEVGDDVLGDDPTVLRLQDRVAELLNKPAAVFVPSGSMANQTAIRAHTQPGDEIACHEDSHIIHYETGGPAALSGVMIRPLAGADGQFDAPDLLASLRPFSAHFPHTTMMLIENTQQPLRRRGLAHRQGPARHRRARGAGRQASPRPRAPLAERKQIRMELESMPEEQVEADRELLEYAIYNLVTNAIKYSPSQTEVRVSAARENGQLRLSVRDQGIGMDEKEVKQIFQRFYRTRRAVQSGETGTGIGLSIVEQIVTQHGGRIDVQSRPNHGSCFTIVLPLDRSTA